MRAHLAPHVVDVDVQGFYPEVFLREAGAAGLFRAHVPREMGGLGLGFDGLVLGIEAVARVCGATGFLTWCQSALAWYLVQTDNSTLRERLLQQVINAKTLGGTGLSNLMKNCSGIEPLRLTGVRVDGGYRIDGTLPWVSNLGEDHWFGFGFRVGEQGTALAVVQGGREGLSMVRGAHFTALEGTRTLACQFRDVFIPDADILASPQAFEGFVRRIKPGFILAQCGIALGVIADCVDIAEKSNETLAHVNGFLSDSASELRQAYERSRGSILDLGRRVTCGASHFDAREVLQARVQGSELALRASTSAILHAGAKGYLLRHPAQRRVREAIFVAIVTPAIKHLRKELAGYAVARAEN